MNTKQTYVPLDLSLVKSPEALEQTMKDSIAYLGGERRHTSRLEGPECIFDQLSLAQNKQLWTLAFKVQYNNLYCTSVKADCELLGISKSAYSKLITELVSMNLLHIVNKDMRAKGDRLYMFSPSVVWYGYLGHRDNAERQWAIYPDKRPVYY